MNLVSWIIKRRAQALGAICGIVTLLALVVYMLTYPSLVGESLRYALNPSKMGPDEIGTGDQAATFFYEAAAVLPAFKSLREIELQTQDQRLHFGRRATMSDEIVFLAIDDATISQDQLWEDEIEASEALKKMQGGWPFNRGAYALVLEKLVNAGAKAVGFDLVFTMPKEGDDELKAALEKYKDKVVIGSNIIWVESDDFEGEVIRQPPASVLPPGEVSDVTASINVFPDEDQVLRAINYNRFVGKGEFQTKVKSFAHLLLEKAGHGDKVPKDPMSRIIRYAGKRYTFTPHPLFQIFVPTYWEGREIEGEVIPGKFQNGEFFKDKIVIVGPEGHILKDEMLSPYGSMPGPEIHMNALNALLQNEFLDSTTHPVNILTIILAGALAWVVLYSVKSVWMSTLSFGIIIFGYLAFSQALFNKHDLYILVFLPMMTFFSCGAMGIIAEYVAEKYERSRTRSTLERFVSKNIVKEVMENPDSFYNKLGGTRLPITVFFSDVRGFTTMTEESDPEQLIAQLNEYLRVMGDAVVINNGILDKFIGDAIMATWGNINSEGFEADAKHAVAASLEMRRRLRDLNAAWGALGWKTWAFGIGLHQGEAIVGSIGSDKIKQDPTVIGDTINTGARMESSTKKYKVDLLVSDVMKPHLVDHYHLQSVDKVVFKGKSKAVEIFTVIDEKSKELEPETVEYLKVYHEALETFRPPKRDFTKARELFTQAMKHRPEDHLCTMYIERCRSYEENPPAKEWQGEEVATSK